VTLKDAVYILFARWKTLVLLTVAVTILAVAYATLTTPTYAGSTRIFIATAATPDDLDAYSAGRLAQGRMASYKDLILSDTLATRTVKRLKLNIAPRDLAKEVNAELHLDSVMITITVTDKSASDAVSLANALSEDFTGMVQDLETPAGGGPPAVRAVIVQSATDSTFVSPDRPKIIVFGVFAGLLLGVTVALVRGRPGKRDRGGHETDVEATIGTASNGSRSWSLGGKQLTADHPKIH
jgi:capsular polysaccharide biosynthesis protein